MGALFFHRLPVLIQDSLRDGYNIWSWYPWCFHSSAKSCFLCVGRQAGWVALSSQTGNTCNNTIMVESVESC